jgi:hypothetical protein
MTHLQKLVRASNPVEEGKRPDRVTESNALVRSMKARYGGLFLQLPEGEHHIDG